MDPVVGIAEIAGILGVSRQRAVQLTHGETFPAPFSELASGRIWEREAVEQWARETGRIK
jgi:hypothetical protein